MSIIQQPTLFDIDYLEKLDIQEKYKEIFSPIDWTNKFFCYFMYQIKLEIFMYTYLH